MFDAAIAAAQPARCVPPHLPESPRGRPLVNDGHGFFQALGDSVITGPTLTNVNHFRAILVTGCE